MDRIKVGKVIVENEETAQLGHKRSNPEAVPAAETIQNYRSLGLNPSQMLALLIFTITSSYSYPQDQDKELKGPPNPIERPLRATQGDLDFLFSLKVCQISRTAS